MKRIIGVGILILFLGASAQAGYVDTKTLEISADGIEKLKVDCGAGYLDIEGVDDLDAIVVEAEIVLDGISEKKAKKVIEDHLELTLEKKGKSVKLISGFDQSSSVIGNIFSRGSKQINLTVKIPKHLALSIDDGSGEIWIRSIENDINLDDGSGEMEIEDIVGDVEIDDGSGEIRIINVTGNVEISDGSGEIYVRKIDGDVIVSDGSGDINISIVSQDVEVVDDGSGDCRITKVDGRVYEP